MGCAASLSAKYLPAPKPEASTSQASTAPAAKIDEKGGETPHPQEPKKWTRMEMGQLTVPQLVRWLEALNADLTAAVPPPRARKRLWQEIQKSPPPALEQVTSLSHLDHWPLPETLRWLEYFDALDEDVAAKDKLIAMLLDFGEDLPPPPNFSETAEANFLTEVQRHVDMVKQAVTAIVTQLSEQLAEADAQERPKHAWYANGKALTDFKPAEIKATEQMDIPFIELKVGDRVDLTLQEGSGWAWIVNEGEQSHGWAPASAVTEFALALQDYAAEEAESLRCQKGEEFEVILRHYSGWTLCRRPKPGEQTPTTLSGDAEEGWLPDTCLSDHPRNMNTKQQHLILAGLHRLASDVAGVESAFYRIQTEGSTEEDSLQTLHAKVCALADEYRSIVAVIQANPQLLGQEAPEPKEEEEAQGDFAALGLPAWIRVEGHCYYVSKTQKKLMSVTIKRVCEVRRQILVTFDADRNARKIVEFAAFENMSTCPLQPKEKAKRGKKKKQAREAVAAAQDELAEDLRGMIQDLGPPGDLATETDSDSSYDSSDYTSSTASGYDREPTAPEQESGCSTAAGVSGQAESSSEPEVRAAAQESREVQAAVQIQAAFRRYHQARFRVPAAPCSPSRREGAVRFVQSVLRSFLAKVCLVAAAEEAEAAAAAAAADAAAAAAAAEAEAAAAAAKAQAGACVAAVLRRFQARQQLQAAAAAFAVKEEAARLLQSAALRFGAQALLLQLGAEDAALREAAALRLQSAQRTHSAQRELARRKARRDGLLLLSPGKHRAVRQLQKCCRRYLAQCTLRAAEHRRSRAAAQVQALWRAHRCRLQLAETLREWRDGRAQAASRLQSMVRGVKAKQELREGKMMRSAAAQWIQTTWRRHRATEITRELRQRRAQLRASMRVQSHWRGHSSRARTTPQLKRRQIAAARIQGLLHMAQSREHAARLREELALRRIGAATRIQSLARGKSIREEVGPLLASRREAAITLQCLVRGVAARRRLQLLRQERASVKVQSAWRRQLAKAEAMRRRAHEANKLLDCLLQGRVPPSDGTPRTGGKAWLEKVTAALEWKAKRDVEEEEKELRCCRQMAFSLIHHAQELTSPESLLASAILDRSIAALGMAKRRARQRMRALLQTQAQGHVPSYEPEVCKSMAVDHGVLIRLNAEDAVAEVANLLQTAWSIAAARRSATPPGGAAPALQVLTSGLRSLKRKLQAESLALGKATPPEEAAALQSLQALAQEACDEAVARASAAREAVLLPLQQELEVAVSDSQATLTALNSAMAKVRPEADAIKKKYKEEAAKAETKLREEREQKHAQTVALHKIAISTQIEKEHLEAGLVDKNRPKLACYKKVFENVKRLQQELKDLEVNGTANRKSQGILQHTLRALESRAAKAESDAKGKVVFGEAEEDVKDFKPSAQVLKKQERSEEQEVQFREALESEVQSLHADMDARAKYEASCQAAQLRAEAEECGQAAQQAEQRLKSWQHRAQERRQWLAEVVPIAKSSAQILAAGDFIKACKSPESEHSLAAGLRAVLKQLLPLGDEAERSSSGAASPREGKLPQQLQKMRTALKALAELKSEFPEMPRSPNAGARKAMYGREDEQDAEVEDAAPRSRIPSSMSTGVPPFPPPAPDDVAAMGEEASSSKPPPRVPPRQAPAKGLGGGLSGLAELSQNLSALSQLAVPVPARAAGLSSAGPSSGAPSSGASSPASPARPLSAAGSRGGPPSRERTDKVSAPLRSAGRPNSAAGSRAARAPEPGAGGSAMKAVQKARAVSSGWE